jgi:Putative Actinobacterial Holin-X, holin superfamily III
MYNPKKYICPVSCYSFNIFYMHSEFKILGKTVDDIKDYANTRIDQIKLGSAERVSDLVSVFIAKALAALVFLFSLLYGSTAAAYGIGDYFNRTWLGFLIVAGIYLLLGWIIWATRERLIQIPIMNGILSRLFNEEIRKNGKN